MVRLALVGCGYWGPKVLRAAASLPEVEVTALVDRELERARATQRHFPAARVAPSQLDVLGDVDAVIVATEAASHHELAAEALAAGAHVLVEKPLALTAADCRALGEQADAAARVLMAGHTFRFSPAVAHVRELLERQELGDVYYVDSQRLNLGRVRGDVDAVWNFAPHDISIVNYWLGGRPAAVRCHGYDYLQDGIDDVGFLILEYDGVVAHVHVSWLSPSKVRRMTVVGSRKMVVYDDVANEKIVLFDAGIDRQHMGRSFGEFESFGEFQLIRRLGDLHIPRLPTVEPLVAELRHFVDCIETGAEPVTGWPEAEAVVATLEAASASRASGGERVPLGGERVARLA
jgi:predicted dehydrogenase